MFFDTQVNRRLSTITRSTKGKQNTFGISRKRVMPVKYSRQKVPQLKLPQWSKQAVDSCQPIQGTKNLFYAPWNSFHSLTGQDRPYLVTQVGKTFFVKISPNYSIQRVVCPTQGLYCFLKQVCQDELRRVTQDENILEISQTYLSKASKVSYPRTEMIYKIDLLG